MSNTIRVEIDIRYETEEGGVPNEAQMAELAEGLKYQIRNLAYNGGLTSGAPELLVDTWKHRVYWRTKNPLSGIDWSLLKDQKLQLLSAIGQAESQDQVVLARALQGLLNLVDAIQDHEVDVNGRPEADVFNLEDEADD